MNDKTSWAHGCKINPVAAIEDARRDGKVSDSEAATCTQAVIESGKSCAETQIQVLHLIDKLFLELSQFTEAKTVNDLKIEELEGIMIEFAKDHESSAAKATALQEVWRVLNG